MGSPSLLILDEPTAGLDPNQIREVRGLISRLSEERTILLSTHILSEVEATCNRAVVIHKGRLVAEGEIAIYDIGGWPRPRWSAVLDWIEARRRPHPNEGSAARSPSAEQR